MLNSFCFAWLQYILPQHLLSLLAGKLADATQPSFKNWLIRRFIKRYQVAMDDALYSQPEDYSSFNQFFTRALKPDARMITTDHHALASPVDGCVSQIGTANDNQLVQAKGAYFTIESLLGGNKTLADTFSNGLYATLYLAPRDYHRVHLPVDGTLLQSIYVPGRLFSVNTATASHIPQLYSRNERLIMVFDTPAGKMALIMVGAMLVGHIKPVFADKPVRAHAITNETFTPPIPMKKGAEVGYFCLGSTVIVLFEQQRAAWSQELATGSYIQMGQAIGHLIT